MADTVDSLQARIDALEAVYDAMVSGQQVSSVRYAEMGETFHAASPNDLRRRIAQLKDQRDRLLGCPPGAIIVRPGS